VVEVARERAQSFLKPEHQERILEAYRTFGGEPAFAKAVTQEEIAAQRYSLSIPL
jgi:type I restriction enzyme M protein